MHEKKPFLQWEKPNTYENEVQAMLPGWQGREAPEQSAILITRNKAHLCENIPAPLLKEPTWQSRGIVSHSAQSPSSPDMMEKEKGDHPSPLAHGALG